MGSSDGQWSADNAPPIIALQMRRAREQSEQTTRSLSMMTMNMGLYSPSPNILPTPKVPIPRQSYYNDCTSKPRARKACKECRDQKTKCDGCQPCIRCSGLEIECVYVGGKKEIMNRRLEELQNQVEVYERLLRRVQFQATHEDEELIARTLAQYSLSSDPDEGLRDHDSLSPTVEDSSFRIEYIHEDFHRNRSLQPIGFVGGPSELSWIHDLNRAIEKDATFLKANAPNQAENNNAPTLSKVSYFLDDQELTMDENIDPYNRPPPDIAERLLHLFFFTVHPSFPIIAKISFMQQTASYYSQPHLRPTKKWLAILNLVFALAAKYAYLVPELRMNYMDSPMVYFARAWKLSSIDNQLIDHPNLQQVQIEGLTAFLLMAIGHINRSWRACGVAIRSAIAMGINLRSESKETSDISKEIRYRVWWSVYTLENTLSIMTGRPTGTADRFCTTPLPIPFDEEQFHGAAASQLLADLNVRREYMRTFTFTKRQYSGTPDPPADGNAGRRNSAPNLADMTPSNSLYYVYFVELTTIMRRAIDSLYSPAFARRAWLTVNAAMIDLVDETDVWLSGLPEVFQFKSTRVSPEFERQRWSLAFRFYSLRITISRPALCRSGRQRRGKETSPTIQRAADICIDSACQILDLLPDQPDVSWLSQVSPWWCVLHYLMQSVTVLLIELEYCVKTYSDKTANINSHIEKSLHWLFAMATDNVAAQRAWKVCYDLHYRLYPPSAIEQSPPSDYATAVPTVGELGSSCPLPMQNNPFIPVSSAPQSMGVSAFLDTEIPHNTMFHPTLQTVYDEFMPCDLDGA